MGELMMRWVVPESLPVPGLAKINKDSPLNHALIENDNCELDRKIDQVEMFNVQLATKA